MYALKWCQSHECGWFCIVLMQSLSWCICCPQNTTPKVHRQSLIASHLFLGHAFHQMEKYYNSSERRFGFFWIQKIRIHKKTHTVECGLQAKTYGPPLFNPLRFTFATRNCERVAKDEERVINSVSIWFICGRNLWQRFFFLASKKKWNLCE